MNIFLIHNYYKNYGGEDFVVNELLKILKQNNNVVPIFEYNKEIDTYSIPHKLTMVLNSYNNKSLKDTVNKLIKNNKKSVAHIHNIYPLISPSIYEIFKENSIPIIQSVHNFRFICPNGLFFNNNHICEECLNISYYSCFKNKCYKNNYIYSLWYADIIQNARKRGYYDNIDYFVVWQDFVKLKMIEAGFKEEKIITIPNFVPESAHIENIRKRNYYLYIGRLSSEKGIITLLKAAAKCHDMVFKIAGDGPLSEYITHKISKHNIKNVELIGFVSGFKKTRVISEAKAMIIPSEWYEQGPLTAIESFSLGTPVIGSRIGGIPYIINDGINGLLFESGNYMDLANKIRMYDSGDITVMSKAAHDSYLENYTPDIYYKKITDLYHKALEIHQ